MWWVSDVHIGDVGVILKVVLHDMGSNFLSWLVNWAVRNLVNTSLSIRFSGRLAWLSATLLLQLDRHTVNWLGLSELSNPRQVKLEVTLGLRKINWLSVGGDISRLLRHGLCLLNGLNIDGMGSILNGDEVEQS